jgi:hypothetical protein
LEELMHRVEWMKMDEIDPAEFENFGVRNSRIYREKFYRLMKASAMGKNECKWLIFMTCLLPSKKRLLDAMRKWDSAPWYPKVNRFINEKMCQYTSQEAADSSNYSIVHCPNAFPFYAAHAWALATGDDQRTVEAFLRHTWAAQLWIDDDMLADQKVYEKHFWNDLVKKGSGKYEQGFKEEYWQIKATDAYPLIFENGKKLEITSDKGYSKKDLEDYLATYSRAAKEQRKRAEKQERRHKRRAEKTRERRTWTDQDYENYRVQKAQKKADRRQRESMGATSSMTLSESDDSEDEYQSHETGGQE